MHWIVLALLATVLYGLWGFFPRLATLHLSPRDALVYQTLGGLPVLFLVLAWLRFRPAYHPHGVLYAFLTGLAGAVGTLCFFAALQRAPSTTSVVMVTALYPLVVILLALIFLREPLTLRQGVGAILALIALVLLSA